MRFIILALIGLAWTSSALAEPRHAIAMHGEPKYQQGYSHFGYVDPGAPKGGRLSLSVLGTFDSLNPLIVRGVAAAGLRGYVYESLLMRALDEPFSLYGHIAETVETPDDRSWVAFAITDKARFSDGKPITVDDVIFSHALLRDKGRPNHRFYYSKVIKVEKIGERTVKFTFSPDGDREMPLIMGLMPIMPKHSVDREKFEQTSLKPPLGSGPYLVAAAEAGTSITYRRNPDYWARDTPALRGRANFDEIHFEYYRDTNAMFEAFKKGLFTVRSEGDPGQWAQAYDFHAAKDGRVKRAEFPIALPSGMSALVFNTRRAPFNDPKVRRALTLLFDFEWLNKNLYHGLYVRTQSYFDRSELSSHGRPADERERALLAKFPNLVRPDVLDGSHAFPVSDGTGRNRQNLRKAMGLLKQAGYVLKNGRLVNAETGKPVAFEIMAATRSQERLLLTFARALKRTGIEARVRQVDSAIYQRRKTSFDFDMVQNNWPASLSPGNEQSFRWSAKSADTQGTFNYPGVKNPAVDAMIEAVLQARSRADFVSAVRALDRVLLSGDYVVPLFHLPKQWVAHWTNLAFPETTSLYGFQLDTWWAQKPTN